MFTWQRWPRKRLSDRRRNNHAVIRAIVLDYAGVMTVPVSMPKKPNSLRSEPDPADVRSVLRSFMSHEVHNSDPTGMWNRVERGEVRFDDFCTYLEKKHQLAGQAFRAMGGNMIAGLALRTMMADRVREWRGSGLKVGLLTNNVMEWRPIWRSKLEEANLLDAFDAVVDSSEVGMRKPESRIFLHAVELLGVAPHEAVFVDDLAQNVEGAVAAGLHAILATPDDAHLVQLDALIRGHRTPLE